MSENQPAARGDDVYQPDPTDADTADRANGELDPDNTLGTPVTEDMGEPGYSPPDHLRGVTRHGTTLREQREGESLDERLSQERPDVVVAGGDGIGDLEDGEGEPVDTESGASLAGRLMAPSGGSTTTVVAEDVGPDDGVSSAEEAAVHEETGIDGA
ncbi:DUF5709 domain-containing protein [Streptomyces sp. Je 1-79]|uniref:DUF5709 domain-containing protein n=1 Tax=Streptomyces sp. Je 1-79 TaxID=2943847 RepID=UPI0021A477F6|nr:DUF5709 domain-containing protein [Streptomyces sp. Je 1-79]MCT4357073.1 DUF5709 domain-containing protein [Streptomyces sp. Je 1-79]